MNLRSSTSPRLARGSAFWSLTNFRRLAFALAFAGASGASAAPFAFSPSGSLAAARAYHTATLLPNGKVLVVGGQRGSTSFATAELYDPAAGAWTPTASITTARVFHTATLLPNGKVLVAGS